MAAKNIKEGYVLNDKIDQIRQTLAGGEFTKLLEVAGKMTQRDYQRNM